jgi:N-acetylmuramoyl-L-alanine amidase
MAWRFSRNARLSVLAAAALLPGSWNLAGIAQANGAATGQKFIVVLDAAHGGDDGGGQVGAANGGTAVAEKNITLALSVRLRSLLTARGIAVVTTREGNVSLASDARAQIANRATANSGGGAACFSLHASESGTGVHIFVSSLAPAATGRFLPWKTAQSAFVARSLKLAGTINAALEHTSIDGGGANSGAASGSGPIPATLGRATLPGVDSMTCPAVAIEMAPIRGTDRKVITDVTDPDYQTQLVEALAAAILEWKTDLETESPKAGGSQP